MQIQEKVMPLEIFEELLKAVSKFLERNLEVFGVSDLLKLPSRTFNGKIEPKKETLAEFHAVEEAVKKIELYGDHIRYPINVRVKGGFNESDDNRPYSTTKPHTDIWAGDAPNSFVHIIPIFGDMVGNGMRFAETEVKDKDNFYKQHASYDEAMKTVGRLKWKNLQMRPMSYFIVDPCCIHQTLQSTEGFRVSIDLRTSQGPAEAAKYSDLYIPKDEFLKRNFETDETVKSTLEKFK